MLYIDHSFHQKTTSTLFMLEALQSVADVEEFWDKGWEGGESFNPHSYNGREPDVVVFFQTEPPTEMFAMWSCPVVVIPMADSPYSWPTDICLRLSKSLVIAFGKAQAEMYRSKGVQVLPITYACTPPVAKQDTGDGLTAFFWERSQVRWRHVKTVLANTNVKRVLVKLAPDPGQAPSEISSEDRAAFNIEFVEAWGSKEDYWRLLSECDLYFAPRAKEGIGMSYLEAMAMGLCVIAPNNETMNEYIEHGVTGFLYNLETVSPIDLTDNREIGRAASESMSEKLRQFPASVDQVISTVLSLPTRRPSIKTKTMCKLIEMAKRANLRIVVRKVRSILRPMRAK